MPEWADPVVWWQVVPLRFLSAPAIRLPDSAPVQHRLPRLEGWLDYLADLGCTGLALGPVHMSGTHGYDTVDHLQVDTRLGTRDDLARLVAACHDRGIRVLLDGVFNHVGRDFPRFQDVLHRGRESPWCDWFRLDFRGGAGGGDGFDYATFEGHRGLVALNHDNPAVADWVVDVLLSWTDPGWGIAADGWRLDAAYHVPTSFWRTVTDRARAVRPDLWFVGEVIHGRYQDWVSEGGLDSVTQYELWKAVWSALNDRNFFELSWAMKRHQEFAEAFPPQIFVGNHDVTRLASKLHRREYVGHALAVLFTVPGIPSVYYGDEQGWLGVKEDRAGGDDAIRPAFPDRPDQLHPADPATYALHRRLIAIRRDRPWLTTAHGTVDVLTNEQFAYTVTAAGAAGVSITGTRLRVLLNVADREHRFSVGNAGLPGRVLASSADPGADLLRGDVCVVPANGWVVLGG